MSEINELIQVLAANAHLNFVQRIMNRDRYPVLENPDKTVSTHSMAWATVNGWPVVYPTVVQRGDRLVRLGDDEAYHHAMDSGEYIQFEREEEADWFSRNYKKIWKSR